MQANRHLALAEQAIELLEGHHMFSGNPTLHVVDHVGTCLSRDFGESKRKERKNVVRVTGIL